MVARRNGTTTRRTLGALVVAGLVLAACAEQPLEDDAAPDQDEPAAEGIVVGSANFPESQTLGHVLATALEDAGYDVEREMNIGSRETYYPALARGDVDLMPEYVGSLLSHLQGGTELTDTDEILAELREELADDGLVALEPSEAENRNALVVKPDLADELGLQTTSDLIDHGDDLVLGGAPETRERADGLPGYEEVYGLTFAEFVDLDPGGPLTIGALDNDDVDVARLFTSMPVISERGWVILDDDGGLIPAENIVPVAREEVVDDTVEQVLGEVMAALTLDELVGMNERVELDEADHDLVAEEWLREQGLID